jgi:hypothetical protein
MHLWTLRAPVVLPRRKDRDVNKTGLALSIQQPWAWLIVRPDVTDPERRAALYVSREIKDVENRTWATRVRGIVGIHAGKKVDWDAVEEIRCIAPEIQLPETFETGGIVGRAEIVDCVEDMDSRWFFGPYGFVVRNAEPLPLMPCRGKLGFFRPTLVTERTPLHE